MKSENAYIPPVPQPPEVIQVRSKRVACDGGTGSLGHPLVYMEMGASDWVECGYCDRRFELVAGAEGDPGEVNAPGAVGTETNHPSRE